MPLLQAQVLMGVNRIGMKGIEDGTGRLVDKDGKDRSPGDHPDTGQYDTAQMMRDEMYGGDTSQPLFD